MVDPQPTPPVQPENGVTPPPTGGQQQGDNSQQSNPQQPNDSEANGVPRENPNVQKGVFGGSAEAVDQMIGQDAHSGETSGDTDSAVSKPQTESALDFDADTDQQVGTTSQLPDDSGETFNFDEIHFDDEQSSQSSQTISDTSREESAQDVGVDIEEKQDVPSKPSPKDVVVDDNKDDEQVVASDMDKQTTKTDQSGDGVVGDDKSGAIHDLFDLVYDKVEQLYELRDVEEGDSVSVGDYSFLVDNFADDIIKIRKGDVSISLMMETGVFELLLNEQLLFAEKDLVDDGEKFLELKDKLDKFLALLDEALQVEKKKQEEAKRQAEEQKRMRQSFADF